MSYAEDIKEEDAKLRAKTLATLKDICFGKMCTYANIDFKECTHLAAYRERLEAEDEDGGFGQ